MSDNMASLSCLRVLTVMLGNPDFDLDEDDEDYVCSHAIAGDLFVWRFKLRWEVTPSPDDEVLEALTQRQKDLEEARDEEIERIWKKTFEEMAI